MVQTRSAAKKVNLISDIDSNRTESTRDEDATAGLGVPGVQQRSKRINARRNGPQTQAQRTSRGQSMRGKLAMLPDINLDVLSQILSYLLPMDLLNLARLTRPFRQFLMSKAHAFLWVAARKQVDGLPDCPPDMSEPEYANLAFDIHCHSCGGVVYTIYWMIRRRYCPGCRAKRLRVAEECDSLPDTLGMLPSEYLEGIIELRGETSFVDKQQYNAVYKEYLKTPIGKRNAFINRRCEIVAHREKQADECMRWHLTVLEARKKRLRNAREARQESIFARLEDAGYEREIRHFGEGYIMSYQREVFRTSRCLTEKEWEEVNSKLEPRMIKLREERLEEKVIRPRQRLLVKVYDRYIQHPAPDGRAVDLLPCVCDVAGFAPFEAIINLPEDQLVDEKTVLSSLDQLPALTRQWRDEVDAQMASIVSNVTVPSMRTSADRQKRPDVPPKQLLQLACAVFEVRGYSKCDLFTYPQILLESSVFYEPYGPMPNRAARPWSLPKEGSKSVQLFTGALDVVVRCGLDPLVATGDDMDQASARLICNECRESSPTSVEIFDWKSAIYHAYRHHLDKVGLPERWTRVDKNLVTLAEAAERSCTPQHSPSLVYCALCQPRALATKYKLVNDDSGSRRPQLSDHFSKAHGIQEIEGPLQENVHYVALGGLASRRTVRMITEGRGGLV